MPEHHASQGHAGMHVQVDAVILSVTAIAAVLLWQIFQQRMFLEMLKGMVDGVYISQIKSKRVGIGLS